MISLFYTTFEDNMSKKVLSDGKNLKKKKKILPMSILMEFEVTYKIFLTPEENVS